MPNLYYMIDDATPPSEADEAAIKQAGVSIIAPYVGGINNGGREWTPSDAAYWRNQGFLEMGIYVGENACPGCATPVVLTASRGAIDGRDALSHAVAFGLTNGPLALDLEEATTATYPAAWQAYAYSWADVVYHAHYLPVLYLSPVAARQYVPDCPTGLWLAEWNEKMDLTDIPNPSLWHGVAHQFSDNWHGFDGSVTDGIWWNMTQDTAGASQSFQNGFGIGGGIYQYWKANGGIIAFGMPISHEYDVTINGKTVTRQWFERAILERIAGQWPAEWDVEGVRLGSMLAGQAPGLTQYQDDLKLYPAAFKP